MKIKFLGGVETVTGSKTLIQSGETTVLVDCGLFQGIKKLREKNWDKLPVEPSKIDAVILTHAHLDHSGYIPRLVSQGFEGSIYCTTPTEALCKILLEDSGRLHEEDAGYANRKGFSKHSPALALYTEADATVSLRSFKSVSYNEPIKVGEIEFHFAPAGHILGAASVYLKAEGKTFLFSGDLGRPEDPMLPAPAAPEPVDYLMIESTYGDRTHEDIDPMEVLESVINKTVGRNGVLIIPAFAVGRSQEILYYISNLMRLKRIPDVPLYMNSPMAKSVTHLYAEFHMYHKLERAEFETLCDRVTFINSVEESIKLNLQTGPMVIICASGMLTGGRVLHHLKAFGANSNNTVLLVGYQPPGTRGWALLNGKDKVKIHGHYQVINAEVLSNDCFSAHADSIELVEWASKLKKPPKGIFLVHGEPASADSLRVALADSLGEVKIIAPGLNDEFEF